MPKKTEQKKIVKATKKASKNGNEKAVRPIIEQEEAKSFWYSRNKDDGELVDQIEELMEEIEDLPKAERANVKNFLKAHLVDVWRETEEGFENAKIVEWRIFGANVYDAKEDLKAKGWKFQKGDYYWYEPKKQDSGGAVKLPGTNVYVDGIKQGQRIYWKVPFYHEGSSRSFVPGIRDNNLTVQIPIDIYLQMKIFGIPVPEGDLARGLYDTLVVSI